ncbi:hypothetical protein KDAU_65190 [Dictyobacter aurantiacus]|uniref:TraD/TraG TraM recognition site domain-containing protein n=2 Tax=Dictyobacter aurantiacus TaxID=1936993 RepID=A0A401ZQV6_9CHLR|nr:hypothetical protein KDAU_65190 [Dictyobacter aurantiacus]
MSSSATAPTIQIPPSSPVDVIATPVGAEHVLLILPGEEGELQASAMENFFQACATDEAFSLELVGTRREQGFVLRASSAEQLVLLSKQFSAQYPQAELHRIAPAADPLFLHPGEHAMIGEFALTQRPWMPLKTFPGKTLAEPGADPLAGILAAMEPLGSGQRCIAQLALVRAPDTWISRYIRKSIEHPLQGERDAITREGKHTTTTTEGLKTLLLIGGSFGILLGSRWYLAHAWVHLALLGIALVMGGIMLLWWKITRSHQDMYDMKLVAEKLSRQAFYTRLRVVVIGQQASSTHIQLKAHITRLEVAYRQFTLASANSLYLKRVRYIRAEHKQASRLIHAAAAFPYQHPVLRFLHGGAPGPDICNGLELSGAFHLPQAFTDLPLVRRLSVKHLLASPEIAAQIEQAPAPLPPALIGHSRHRGFSIPVYLPYDTLFRHTFLAARSRYGKSTLIQLLAQAAMQPIRHGMPQPGIFVIDPHKDLIEDLLLLIPPQRAQDVILLDLTDTNYVVALNPLDASMGFTRDQAIANVMSSFERVWADFWGPRMSYFLKAVCLLLYSLNQKKVRQGQADQQYTLLDINPLLQYPDYALQVLQELDMAEVWHRELLAWWQHVYFNLPKQSSFRSEVIMPIVTKLGVFQDNQQLRKIVGQPITKAPIHLSVTEGKIILCALSSRDMDDAAVNVLGSTLINLLHRAFRMQEPLPLLKRRKVFCAVDEFHAFSGGDYDRLLSEDGKFGCSMLLATQNLKRLNKIRDGLLEMVFSTCDTICAFNVSAADAELLEKELRQVVEQRHIISQPRLHCYARLAIPSYPVQIVSVSLARPSSWSHTAASQQQAEAIRHSNQQQNARAADIDQHYARHVSQFLDVALFVQKMQRDVQAEQKARQEREEADQRAEALRQQGLNISSPQPSSSTVADESKQQSSDAGDTPATIGSSLAGGSSARGTGTHEENEGKRNHPRSRRNKATKDPVGVPPPSQPQNNPQPIPSNQQENRPIILPERSMKGRAFWGSERERGE